MNWYLAKLIFRIVVGEGNHQSQFDEQLRLIRAVDKQEAFEKARLLGHKLQVQDRFLNNQQQWVNWQFLNVIELCEIESLVDGAELYYQIAEPDNAAKYIKIVHQKADDIERSLQNRYSQIELE